MNISYNDRMFLRIKKFKQFIGDKVWKYLCITAMLGPLWFAAESSLVYILQGFLFSVGLLQKEQTFLPDWYPTSLGSTVLILVIFGFARAGIHMMRIHFSNLTQVSFTCFQRKNLLTYGLRNAEKISTKEILSLFTEIATQSGGVILNLALLVNLVISSTLLFGAGLKLAPIEMGIGISLLFIFLYPLRYMSRKINTAGFGLISEWENIGESLLLGLKNNFFLKVYKQVDVEVSKGANSLNNYQSHYMSYSLISGFVNAFPLLIGVMVLSCITYLSVTFIHTESMKLISFFYIFIRLAQASSEASSTFSSFKLNLPGLKKLYSWHVEHLRDLQRASESQKKILELNSDTVEVRVENLGFSYGDNKKLFSHLNINLKKKDILVIKGESGTGKSTLLSIILGLNLPTEGKLFFNNIDTSDFHLDLHKVIGYVGPEAYLIQGTLKENLLYGFENNIQVSEAEIFEALKVVDMKDFVLNLPMKLNEPVNDIAQFSTGQKQRLSFARALLRKPSILILDEATANLDSLTEKKMIENLKPYFEKSCTIIVTHKDSFDNLASQHILLGNDNL